MHLNHRQLLLVSLCVLTHIHKNTNTTSSLWSQSIYSIKGYTPTQAQCVVSEWINQWFIYSLTLQELQAIRLSSQHFGMVPYHYCFWLLCTDLMYTTDTLSILDTLVIGKFQSSCNPLVITLNRYGKLLNYCCVWKSWKIQVK